MNETDAAIRAYIHSWLNVHDKDLASLFRAKFNPSPLSLDSPPIEDVFLHWNYCCRDSSNKRKIQLSSDSSPDGPPIKRARASDSSETEAIGSRALPAAAGPAAVVKIEPVSDEEDENRPPQSAEAAVDLNEAYCEENDVGEKENEPVERPFRDTSKVIVYIGDFVFKNVGVRGATIKSWEKGAVYFVDKDFDVSHWVDLGVPGHRVMQFNLVGWGFEDGIPVCVRGFLDNEVDLKNVTHVIIAGGIDTLRQGLDKDLTAPPGTPPHVHSSVVPFRSLLRTAKDAFPGASIIYAGCSSLRSKRVPGDEGFPASCTSKMLTRCKKHVRLFRKEMARLATKSGEFQCVNAFDRINDKDISDYRGNLDPGRVGFFAGQFQKVVSGVLEEVWETDG